MSQQSIILTPVALFANDSGKTEERGNCACALVGLPGSTPRYNIVCYNEQRVTQCAAAITSSNEQSLNFQLQTNEYGTFRDNEGRSWSCLFLRSADLDLFCAQLAVACFGAAQQPSHTPIIVDLATASKRSSKTVQLGDRVKVRYSAFSLAKGTTTTLPKAGKLLETNGDLPFGFSACQSAYSIVAEGKGFESSVVGMAEDSKRVVVVPATMGRSCGNIFGGDGVVFTLHCTRISAEVPPATGDKSGNPSTDDLSAGALVVPNTQLALANIAPPEVTKPENGSSSSPPPRTESLPTGSGIPIEHMSMVQKVAASINASITSIRDLDDKVHAFNEDWKQTINRPKPSVLTSAALEQNVKQLIAENERVKDEIVRREELIKSLDERNRDLQKRVDKAATVAQELLDEKKTTISSTSDMKLEMDRKQMKLQEDITRARSERDDVQRHLTTVKKLLDMSDAELREVKGKKEVMSVQLQSVGGKLDAAEDSLGEERSRRKAMEAKVAALQEEIRNAATEVHMKTAQLEDARRKADADRVHYAQIMEDERSRRALEAQQLRSEIIEELQLKENKFITDRQRVSEDFHKRGQDEGREIGKKNAAIDVETKVQELQLEAQRSRTELDAYKTQVRTTQDEAMAENRRMEAIVSTLKNAAEEATRKKAQNDFNLQALKTKLRNAEDNMFLAFTNVAHRLTRPADAKDLMELLAALKEEKNPDFSFQAAKHQEERDAAFLQRYKWITEELESQYTTRQSSFFHQQYLPALTAAKDDLTTTIHRLWKEREDSFAGEMFMQETSDRYEVSKSQEEGFQAIESFYSELVRQQDAIRNDEASIRTLTEKESNEFYETLTTFLETQEKERKAITDEELGKRDEAEAESDLVFVSMRADLEKVLFEKIIAEQQEVISDEEKKRADVEAEETEESAAFEKSEKEGMDEAYQQEELRLLQEKHCSEQKEFLEGQEPNNRDMVVGEQATEYENLLHNMAISKPKTPPPQQQAEPPQQQAEEPQNESVPVSKPKTAANPLGDMGSVAVESKNAFNSDSEDEAGFGSKIQAKTSAAPKTSAAKKAPPAKLFESDDSDEEGGGLPAAPPPKPKAAKKPAAKPAKLFDSDSD